MSVTDLHARSVFSWPGHLDEDEKEGRDHRKERGKRRQGEGELKEAKVKGNDRRRR